MGGIKIPLSTRYLRGAAIMIFVSVGTSNKGFDRLLRACDQIALRTGLPFFAQTGSSAYIPNHLPHQAWLSRAEMQERYQSASAFIVHGGFGTLSETLKYGKSIFVVARRLEDGEAVNNQADLAIKLHSLGLVHYIEKLEELESVLLLREPYKQQANKLTTNIPAIIQNYITHLLFP